MLRTNFCYAEYMNKILMVDDDTELIKMYRAKLTQEGFEFMDAMDGEEGLALALKNHPDLILLDINMPKMDGVTMMRKLRGNDWGRTVPIVIISNLEANDERMRSIVEDEPAYYLLKPSHTLADVVSKIEEVLARPFGTE